MANSEAVISMVSKESLRLYKNNLQIGKMCNRQFDDYYGKPGGKIGQNLQVRLPVKFSSNTGTSFSALDVTDRTVTEVMGTQRHVDFTFTRAEFLQSVDMIRDRYIRPAINTLAAMTDADGATELMNKTYNFSGTAGTPPANIQAVTDAYQYIMDQACPSLSDVNLALTPLSNGRLIAGTSTLFAPTDKIGGQYVKGAFSGNTLGLNSLMLTQSLPSYTVGAGPGGTPVTTGTFSEGGTTVGVTGGSGSVTNAYRKGDVITIGGVYAVNPLTKAQTPYLQRFVVQANANTSTGAATLSVLPAMYSSTSANQQNISAQPSGGAAITVISGTANTAYRQNLLFHQDALIFVTAALPKPEGVHMAETITSDDGFSLSMVAQYDIQTDSFKFRIDTLYGWIAGMNEWACRITE